MLGPISILHMSVLGIMRASQYAQPAFFQHVHTLGADSHVV